MGTTTTTTTVVLALLSLASSLLVLVGSTSSTLRKPRKGRRCRLNLQRLGLWQRLQFWICVLDSILLLAVTPLFVYYFYHRVEGEVIWDVALRSPASTFAVTALLVLRPVLVSALTGSSYLHTSNRRGCGVMLLIAGVAIVGAVSATSAVACSRHSLTGASCAAVPSVKIITIAVECGFAILATSILIAIRKLAKTREARLLHAQQPTCRPSTTASRAPSLSLLIHTQSDPWTRHIDLDLPHHDDDRRDPIHTDFGPPIHKPPPRKQDFNHEPDYGPKMVQGLLGDTGTASDRMTDAATASLGYGSAVASSANPYHVGSTFSLASRDALGGFGSSRLDLVESKAGSVPKYQTSTSKSSSSPSKFEPSSASSSQPRIVPNLESTSRASSRAAMLQGRVQSESKAAGGLLVSESRAHLLRLIAVIVSLWCAVGLSAVALLMKASSGQAHILLVSFCSPAAILLCQELAQHLIQQTDPRKETAAFSPNSEDPDRSTSEQVDGSSQRASIATSTVIVYENRDSLRSRRPHLRSYSCPLESEINGYSNPFLDSDASGKARHSKQRQSLSSAKSVPYLSQHWTAGKVKGDRVVAPRSSFIRGLNLMINPRPKLEILPAHSQSSIHKHREYEGSEGGQRVSLLPASVTSAIVEGLLDVPRNQEHVTTDSERTCITHSLSQDRTYAASPVMSWQQEEGAGEATSVDFDQSNIDERSTDVILDMDETPGSPRRADTYSISVDPSLRSPTKRRMLTPPASTCTPEQAAATTSFSQNDNSQVMGSSASRLFSEIMDMVRGGHQRVSDQPSGLFRGNNLQRTPPKGYASIDGGMTREQPSIYNSADSEGATMIVHPDETSCDFQTAASHGATSVTRTGADLGLSEQETTATWNGAVQRESELTRKGSTSSTLSFSSISSRIRSIGRSSVAGFGGSPSATPSAGDDQRIKVKKMRSRTFASAFGIELGLLSRNGSRSRRDTPGSNVESSPSTSSGTCPSSLMDLSFSPSPASTRQGEPSPGDHITMRSHRRNQSRADSIMDMLDDEHGDTIEEMLDPVGVRISSVYAAESGEYREADFVALMGCANQEGEDTVAKVAAVDELEEVDLGDVTVNDVWERCFPPQTEDEKMTSNFDGKNVEGEGASGEWDEDVVMGAEMTRLARAPLLDTVEEESEGEREAEDNAQLTWSTVINGTDLNVGSKVSSPKSIADEKRPGGEKSEEQTRSAEVECRASRESLLLEREAKERQITELLAEHEIMFPHKTLSQIVEVTELPTGSRLSGQRTSSGASGSKLSREGMSSTTTDSGAIRLGLPLSLRCQQETPLGDDTGQMTDWTAGTVTGEVAIEEQEGSRLDESSEDSAKLRARQLAFVTPRSKMRCRVAATRKFFKDETLATASTSNINEARVDPSPRSVNVRLGQLGMDQGIWARSPIKLDLESSSVASQDRSDRRSTDQDGSFQIIDLVSTEAGDNPSTRLRRSLTLSKGRLSSDGKGTMMRKLARLDHHHDSPKREHRNRLAKVSSGNGYRGAAQATNASSPREAIGLNQEVLSSSRKSVTGAGQSQSPAHEKRLLHKPFKKRRKSRMKGVAVMIARHQFTVVDEDDSLIQRLNAAQQQPTCAPSSSSDATKA